MKRREFFVGAAGAGVAAIALGRPGFAQERYEPTFRAIREGMAPDATPGMAVESIPRYPDTALVHALDPRFYKYMVGNTYVQRLWTGALWAEGPVYFGDTKTLVFSDIPNNRLMKYDEVSGHMSVLRQPSSYNNGNTRDRQGRLLGCLQDDRCVTRTEYDGTLTKLATEYDGKKLNGPNDIVVKSDNSIWFTDPGYGIGSFYESTHQTNAELPRTVYRFEPNSGKLDIVSKDQVRPNGLAFSPDEKKIYICDTGITDGPDKPSNIMVYDVTDDNHLTNGKVLFDMKQAVPQIASMVQNHLRDHGMLTAADMNHMAASGTSTPSGNAAGGAPQQKAEGPEAGFFKYGIADGIRLDTDGNIWAGTGWGGPAIDGVTVIAADGTPIGRIFLPEVVANVAFGGEKKNRLYMAGSTSLYAVYVSVAGAMPV
jgi:gluconolactonase